jgi:hypothetical protein
LKKISSFLFISILITSNLSAQSGTLVQETTSASFKMGSMESTINTYYSSDSYSSKMIFSFKGKGLARLMSRDAENATIISFSDSTIVKINYKKKRFSKKKLSEALEEIKSNLNKISEDNNANEVDESPSPIISDTLEMINGFESYKITLVDEDGSEQFIWVANTLRKSNTAKMMQEKIEAYERSWMNFDGDFSEIGIDPDGIIVKAIFGDSEGSFEYNLTKYIDTDTPPEIFNQPKNFKKVKKLKMF